MQDSIIKAAIEIKHNFFIFSDSALVFIPQHNADYTCTNCANGKYRRNDMPNCIILATFKFVEITYVLSSFRPMKWVNSKESPQEIIRNIRKWEY